MIYIQDISISSCSIEFCNKSKRDIIKLKVKSIVQGSDTLFTTTRTEIEEMPVETSAYFSDSIEPVKTKQKARINQELNSDKFSGNVLNANSTVTTIVVYKVPTLQGYGANQIDGNKVFAGNRQKIRALKETMADGQYIPNHHNGM